jgi:hypothetical protein
MEGGGRLIVSRPYCPLPTGILPLLFRRAYQLRIRIVSRGKRVSNKEDTMRDLSLIAMLPKSNPKSHPNPNLNPDVTKQLLYYCWERYHSLHGAPIRLEHPFLSFISAFDLTVKKSKAVLFVSME